MSEEPRALTTALSSPAFVTKGGGLAMHVANRHVARWAPEVGEEGANRLRPLRNLGFVDRLVSPWIESAQRSASMRMFSQYIASGAGERQVNNVSWVFPRPWYQDELDWMAAARTVGAQSAMAQQSAPQMLTTRGTYVAPAQQPSQIALPTALYEFVAPSLSIARPDTGSVSDAYSPLVPLAATQAAQVMARVFAPLMNPQRGAQAAAHMSPGLRSVLSTMLERSAFGSPTETVPSRISAYAPELVTPPAPRAAESASIAPANVSYESTQATQIAEQYAEQHARIADLQRVARVAAEREYAVREATRTASPTSGADTSVDRRVIEQRQAEVQQRQAEVQQRATEIAAQRATEGAEKRATEVATQRAQPALAEQTARREAERVAVETERARIEERISHRIAERTAQHEAQRLHSQSRDAAARDARTGVVATQPASAPDVAPVENRFATDIAAAVAALPPELSSMVAASIGSRPDRAVQAIAELGEALRAVELMARHSATGGSLETTRGPRLVMPTGLGGLVATVERTTGGERTQQRMPAFAMQSAAMPSVASGAQPRPMTPMTTMSSMRMPAMAFLAAPNAQVPASAAAAPTSALGAASSSTPAALSHVAWSDRWLARFAGAKPQSLDMLAATSAAPEMRLDMLAAAAPNTVFVAPFFDDDRPRTMPAFVDDTVVRASGEVLPTLRNPQPMQSAARYADDAETPDDVLMAIAAAASGKRTRAAGSTVAAPAAPAVSPPTQAPVFDRETLADIVAHGAPHAPGAGLSAGLASSPFAPALSHLIPLGGAPAFDVRALFGAGLGATYLAGLLSGAPDEISVAATALPTWATWADNRIGGSVGAFESEPSMRDVADWQPTYVAPEQPHATVDATAPGEAGAVADVASLEQLVAREQIAVEQSSAREQFAAEYAAPLTTLRSALLSYEIETLSAQGGSTEMRVSAPSVTSASTPLARSMIEAMTMPMLADTAAFRDVGSFDIGGMTQHAASYAQPGMIGDRAQAWSVAQERSTSDLAFDFVSPELVLAARVYGLGPAEAAQAARLAAAGPGQLTAMAGAVDRTFVQALAIESERRGERGSNMLTTAFPLTSDTPRRTESARAEAVRAESARAEASGEFERAADELPMFAMPSTSAFGVPRRTPRGAFLWPAATTAALGLNAAAPDGELSMSVAALELLAAQAVAELGTYAALGERVTIGEDGAPMLGGDHAPGVPSARGAMPLPSGAEPLEADVLASAEALVPSSRREKFRALYLALDQSPAGRAGSPAARAARALALAGRGGETTSARERAAIAWDVMPMVSGLSEFDTENLSTGDAAVRTSRRREELRALDPMFVDGRPGLSGLSARAGEALGSYVASGAGYASSTGSAASGASSSSREMGAVMRAPTAAQEMVQTGRPSGRAGGGEVEIPAWFEAAARKMLEDRSSVSDGISLADLTLVQSAAPQQVAASSRHDAGSSQSVGPTPNASAAGGEADKIDIEKLANDVYREILVLMDTARARNGEPYL